MAHLFRFFGEPAADGTWRLSEDESYHLAKVLRLETGTAVEVTDGKGTWAAGSISSVTTREVVVELDGPPTVDPEPSIQLGFAIGALKPGAIDELLPSLVELGVDAIHVFQQMDGAKLRLTDKAVDRWHRILAQAVKQSKRSRIPTLEEHGSVYDFSEATRSWTSRIVLDPDARDTLTQVLARTKPERVLVVAGGEKGFTPTEIKLLAGSGLAGARLGAHILRATTAAVAAMAALAMYREDIT